MKTQLHFPAVLAFILARHACLWVALGFLATLAFGLPPAQAAVTEAWVHRYSNVVSNSNDRAFKVVCDAAGDFIVTGTTSTNPIPLFGPADMLTIKYSGVDGSVLWQKRYTNVNASAVAVDQSGNVVVTGWPATVKYAAADGALLWEQRYTNFGALAVAVDGSGNVVVTGSSDGDYYTAKYAAADGTLLWEQRYSYGGATALAVDSSGNVVVTGTSIGNEGYYDYYTAKYAAVDGTLLWEKRYNGPANSYDQAQAVAVDANGNVVVTGSSRNSSGDDDYYTAKYAATDGALLWEKRYNGQGHNNNDQARALAVDGSGNVVVTGWPATVKYAAADGTLLWEKCYNGPADDYYDAQAVALDGNGNVVVTGSSWNWTNHDYYTAKYAAADGALLWEKRYNGPANGEDVASSLAVGPNGMVAITGTSSGDYATVVYRDDVDPITIALVPAGVRLRFIGIPGRSYTIERAPAVTGPWSTLATLTAPLSGLIEYVDTNPPTVTAFYRTSAP